MTKVLRPALLLFLLLSLITGVLYPVLVTLVSNTAMPEQAAGSLITRDGKIIGSSQIGQNFSDPKYFWGRLSATGPYAYNGALSSGSNLGPLNPVLTENVAVRIDALRLADPDNTAPIPVDLVTASGSGLDPHISPAAAAYQAARVARVRGIAQSSIDALVAEHTQGRQLGIFGESRVNVLQLNLALDALR
jgi:K+-transporting ATPase ATPase C chain